MHRNARFRDAVASGRIGKIAKPKLTHYNGPYPREMLEDARRELISLVDSPDTILWNRIWMKTGIYENGYRDLSFEGFGRASHTFSHAGFHDSVVHMEQSSPEYFGSNLAESQAGPSSTTSYENSIEILEEPNPENISEMMGKFGKKNSNDTDACNVRIEAMNSDEIGDVVNVTMTIGEEGIISVDDVVNEKGECAMQTASQKNVANSKSDIITISDSFVTAEDSPKHDADDSAVEIIDDEVSEVQNPETDAVTLGNAIDENKTKDIVSATVVIDKNGKITIENVVEESDNNIDISSNSICHPVSSMPETINCDESQNKGTPPDVDELEDGEIVSDGDGDAENTTSQQRHAQPECSKIVSLAKDSVAETPSVFIVSHERKNSIMKSSSLSSNSCGAVFKCDFCDTYCEDSASMRDHLIGSVHFSASSYFTDDQKNVVRVKDKMCVTNKAAMCKTKLAVCALARCHKPFSNIFECAYHYTLTHNNTSEPIYGLVDVNESVYLNQIDPLKCVECGKVERSVNKLASHYRRICKPSFLHRRSRKKVYYVCSACSQCFKSFRPLLDHQRKKHISTAVDGCLEMRVLVSNNKTLFSLNDVGKIIPSLDEEAKPDFALDADNDDAADFDQVTNDAAANDMDEEADMFFLDRTPNVELDPFATPYNSHVVPMENRYSAAGEVEIIPEDVGIAVDELNANSLQLKFKCDYCVAVSDSFQKMLDHLKSSVHGSASSVYVNGTNKVMYLKKPLMIENYDALLKNVVAVCPESSCDKIFADIFVCSEHFSQDHDALSEPTYAITDVEDSAVAKYAQRPVQCFDCGDIFETRRMYHTHIKKKNHYHHKPSLQHHVCFKCYYCPAMESTYIRMAIHLSQHHKNLEVEDGVFLIRVLYLSTQRIKRKLPPFLDNPLSQKDCIRRKITNLNELKRMAKSKREKRQIRSQIKSFRSLIK